jgi:hypothetical protein
MLLPNAWFYYTLPLAAAGAGFFAGVFVFTVGVRGRGAPARAPRNPAKGLGALCMLVGGSLALAMLFTSPTPWARQRLFDGVRHTPAEQIQRFVIRPADHHQYRPLTQSAVTIDDPATIHRIDDHLSEGKEIAPNHPRTRWTANVEMVTRAATYHFTVTATEPGDINGTLVNVSYKPEGGGWNLGDFQADGLEALLEDAVRHPATTSTTRSPN